MTSAALAAHQRNPGDGDQPRQCRKGGGNEAGGITGTTWELSTGRRLRAWPVPQWDGPTLVREAS